MIPFVFLKVFGGLKPGANLEGAATRGATFYQLQQQFSLQRREWDWVDCTLADDHPGSVGGSSGRVVSKTAGRSFVGWDAGHRCNSL